MPRLHLRIDDWHLLSEDDVTLELEQKCIELHLVGAKAIQMKVIEQYLFVFQPRRMEQTAYRRIWTVGDVGPRNASAQKLLISVLQRHTFRGTDNFITDFHVSSKADPSG